MSRQGASAVPDYKLLLELLGWFAMLFSAGFGNPTPEELIVVAAGIRATTLDEAYGAFRWLLLPTVITGAVAADVLLYGVGRLFGPRLLAWRWTARLAPAENREHIRANLSKYGVIIFIIGRLIPGIRTTLFLTAGTTRVSLLNFLGADFLGALVGNSLIFLLAYFIGDQFKEFIVHLEKQVFAHRPIVFLLLLSAIAGYLLYAFLRRPFPTGDPEEIPLIGKQVASHLPTSSVDINIDDPATQPGKSPIAQSPTTQPGSPHEQPTKNEAM